MTKNKTLDVIMAMDRAEKAVSEALVHFEGHVDKDDDAKRELHLISRRINLVRADMYDRLSLLAKAEADVQRDKAEGIPPVPLAPNMTETKPADGNGEAPAS